MLAINSLLQVPQQAWPSKQDKPRAAGSACMRRSRLVPRQRRSQRAAAHVAESPALGVGVGERVGKEHHTVAPVAVRQPKHLKGGVTEAGR